MELLQCYTVCIVLPDTPEFWPLAVRMDEVWVMPFSTMLSMAAGGNELETEVMPLTISWNKLRKS